MCSGLQPGARSALLCGVRASLFYILIYDDALCALRIPIFLFNYKVRLTPCAWALQCSYIAPCNCPW